MISKLAEMAADAVLQGYDAEEEDRELYAYGFFMLFSHVFYMILTAIYGLIFGIFVESILFYVLFFLTRGYAGGVHAATEWQCMLLTSFALLVSAVLIKLCAVFDLAPLFSALSVPAAICVMWLSPLDAAEKRLTAEEKTEYKRKSVFLAAFISLISFAALLLRLGGVAAACSVSLCMETLALSAGKAREQTEK